MSAREQILKSMSDILRVPREKMRDDAKLTDLGAESFALVEMIIELQEQMKFRVNQEDLANVQNIGQLLDVIEAKLRAKT